MLPASPARLIGILGVTAVQLYSCSHVACGGSGVAVGRMAESDGAVRPERVDECIYSCIVQLSTHYSLQLYTGHDRISRMLIAVYRPVYSVYSAKQQQNLCFMFADTVTIRIKMLTAHDSHTPTGTAGQ